MYQMVYMNEREFLYGYKYRLYDSLVNFVDEPTWLTNTILDALYLWLQSSTHNITWFDVGTWHHYIDNKGYNFVNKTMAKDFDDSPNSFVQPLANSFIFTWL